MQNNQETNGIAMRKFMKTDGPNNYKAFQAALVTHWEKFIVVLSISAEQHCQKPVVFPEERTQYRTQSPWPGYFKELNCSRDVILFIHQLCLRLIHGIKN